MITAKTDKAGRAGESRNTRRNIIRFLSTLELKQRERLRELTALLAESHDHRECLEISQAIIEIVMPTSIGGLGDLHADVREEDRARVARYRKKVGKAIRARREALEMTQRGLAQLAGIPQSHVSRLERGKHAPTHVTMKKIARALGTTSSQLDPGFSDEETG